MRHSKLAFGTQSRKTLPFTLAGLVFFTRPLTVDEDLSLSDVGDRYDLETLEPQETVAFLDEQLVIVADLLQSRVQGEPQPLVTAGWAGMNLGASNLAKVLHFLRTGQRPEGPFELGAWEEETFTVQDREFRPLRPSFAEQREAAMIGAAKSTREAIEGGLAFLALLLTNRAVDEQPVEVAWLRANLGTPDVTALTSYLQNGPQQEAAPNAPAEAASADGSSASAA
ncbi:hypothetical protein DAETH_48130 (plasmid) [Deinococcus aetherius]|uniref:Uncharacterized protein n=1 Tax=Deinococcus aetherius TaxID=200252 RepID=A0ABM8ALW7_9DEIO|nr:hypothetical protein [Deinococcus aetherius]BDP44844.1 hypothetical protein DAETH_48130 [Deinococcus aetherius]